MRKLANPRRSANQRGATLVEFSFMLLGLLTVLFGLIEVFRVSLTYTTLATAARAATRYAIVHGSDRDPTVTGVDGPSSSSNYSQVQNFATNYTRAAGLTASNLTVVVQYPLSSSDVGSPVIVKLTYNYAPFVASLTPLTVTLNTKSEGYITF